jgi:glycosyltransferase involved in cell wall biosynthesis
MAAEIRHLNGGVKELLIIPANWIEDYHGTQNEYGQSEEYILREYQAYFNWKKIWGSKHYHLFILSPRIIFDLIDFKPDFIVLDTEAWSLLSFEIALIRKFFLPRAKIFIRSAQNIYKRYPFPFNLIERFVMGQACAMIARSKEVEQVLRQKGFRLPINVLGFAVDTDRFKPGLDIKYSIDDTKPFHIGYVGSLIRGKGVNLLIDAVSDLNIIFKLTIVGDGIEMAALRTQALNSPKRSNIHFTNTIQNSRLPEIYQMFDVLVVPSLTLLNWKEQFGRVIIEAMACGVTVLGSSSGAIPEVIGDGGIVFEEGNYKALLAGLEELTADGGQLLRKLSSLARRRALEHYSAKVLAMKTFKIFQTYMESSVDS